jgi:hypothetical protein
MRMQRFLSILFFLLLAFSGAALAADCMNGRGELQRPLWDGYTLQIGPAQGDHVNECYAAVIGADGKALFETFGVDATMLRITGRDVNGDGKPDVVLQTHAASSPESVYSVVGTADPAGLIRQIVTMANLSFEERAEGHTEIVTRDTAFRGFEGLSGDQAPAPMIFLRLKGKEIYNVSPAYWAEYERDIAVAKANLAKNDVALFKGEVPNQTQKDKERGLSPQEVAHMQDVKAMILQVVLDYIYGGKGQDAWKAVSDMWPANDRQRIRQEILRVRMGGVMRDISRPAPKPASAQ